MSTADDSSFLARWSRRKTQDRAAPVATAKAPDATATVGTSATAATAATTETAPVDLPASPPVRARPDETPALTAVRVDQPVALAPADGPPPPPPPSLADVAALTRTSDYRRFMAPDVSGDVKNAALKQMFSSDPHFSVMDGLDVYIDDYSKPDPLPLSMLRQMVQSKMLGLFDDEEKEAIEPSAAAMASAAAVEPLADAGGGDDPMADDRMGDVRVGDAQTTTAAAEAEADAAALNPNPAPPAPTST